MSEELKKLEELLANDRKIIEDNYKEIERLNNIIDELEKGLRSCYDFDNGVISKDYLDCVDDTLDKLKELKGSVKNEL